MKKINRLVSLLLIALQILSVTGISFAENATESEIEICEFEAVILPDFDLNATEWLDSKLSRAWFTAILALEWVESTFDTEAEDFNFGDALLNNSSFIGRKGLSIAVCIQDDEQGLLLIYNTITHKVEYGYMDNASDYVIELALENIASESYKNDSDTMLDVIIELLEVLEDIV